MPARSPRAFAFAFSLLALAGCPSVLPWIDPPPYSQEVAAGLGGDPAAADRLCALLDDEDAWDGVSRERARVAIGCLAEIGTAKHLGKIAAIRVIEPLLAKDADEAIAAITDPNRPPVEERARRFRERIEPLIADKSKDARLRLELIQQYAAFAARNDELLARAIILVAKSEPRPDSVQISELIAKLEINTRVAADCAMCFRIEEWVPGVARRAAEYEDQMKGGLRALLLRLHVDDLQRAIDAANGAATDEVLLWAGISRGAGVMLAAIGDPAGINGLAGAFLSLPPGSPGRSALAPLALGLPIGAELAQPIELLSLAMTQDAADTVQAAGFQLAGRAGVRIRRPEADGSDAFLGLSAPGRAAYLRYLAGWNDPSILPGLLALAARIRQDETPDLVFAVTPLLAQPAAIRAAAEAVAATSVVPSRRFGIRFLQQAVGSDQLKLASMLADRMGQSRVPAADREFVASAMLGVALDRATPDDAAAGALDLLSFVPLLPGTHGELLAALPTLGDQAQGAALLQLTRGPLGRAGFDPAAAKAAIAILKTTGDHGVASAGFVFSELSGLPAFEAMAGPVRVANAVRNKLITADTRALSYFLSLMHDAPDAFREPVVRAIGYRDWQLANPGDADAIVLSLWLRELAASGPESGYLLQANRALPRNPRVGRLMLASSEVAFATSAPGALMGWLQAAGEAGDRARVTTLLQRIPADPRMSGTFNAAQLHGIVWAALRALPDRDLPALLAHWSRVAFDARDPEVSAWMAGRPVSGPLAASHDLLMHRLASATDQPITDWATYDAYYGALPLLNAHLKRIDGYAGDDDALTPAFAWAPLRDADARHRAYEALAWLEMTRNDPGTAVAILQLSRFGWNRIAGPSVAADAGAIEDPRIAITAITLATSIRTVDPVRGFLVGEWLYGAAAHIEPLVRREAFTALTMRDRTEFAPGAEQRWAIPFHRVATLVGDEDPRVASAAVSFWAKNPDPAPAQIAAFNAVLATGDEEVALSALTALAKWGKPESLGPAAAFLDSRVGGARQQADVHVHALIRMLDPAHRIKVARDWLGDDNVRANRRVAVRLLEGLTDGGADGPARDVYALAAGAVRDRDPDVARIAGRVCTDIAFRGIDGYAAMCCDLITQHSPASEYALIGLAPIGAGDRAKEVEEAAWVFAYGADDLLAGAALQYLALQAAYDSLPRLATLERANARSQRGVDAAVARAGIAKRLVAAAVADPAACVDRLIAAMASANADGRFLLLDVAAGIESAEVFRLAATAIEAGERSKLVRRAAAAIVGRAGIDRLADPARLASMRAALFADEEIETVKLIETAMPDPASGTPDANVLPIDALVIALERFAAADAEFGARLIRRLEARVRRDAGPELAPRVLAAVRAVPALVEPAWDMLTYASNWRVETTQLLLDAEARPDDALEVVTQRRTELYDLLLRAGANDTIRYAFEHASRDIALRAASDGTPRDALAVAGIPVSALVWKVRGFTRWAPPELKDAIVAFAAASGDPATLSPIAIPASADPATAAAGMAILRETLERWFAGAGTITRASAPGVWRWEAPADLSLDAQGAWTVMRNGWIDGVLASGLLELAAEGEIARPDQFLADFLRVLDYAADWRSAPAMIAAVNTLRSGIDPRIDAAWPTGLAYPPAITRADGRVALSDRLEEMLRVAISRAAWPYRAAPPSLGETEVAPRGIWSDADAQFRGFVPESLLWLDRSGPLAGYLLEVIDAAPVLVPDGVDPGWAPVTVAVGRSLNHADPAVSIRAMTVRARIAAPLTTREDARVAGAFDRVVEERADGLLPPSALQETWVGEIANLVAERGTWDGLPLYMSRANRLRSILAGTVDQLVTRLRAESAWEVGAARPEGAPDITEIVRDSRVLAEVTDPAFTAGQRVALALLADALSSGSREEPCCHGALIAAAGTATGPWLLTYGTDPAWMETAPGVAVTLASEARRLRASTIDDTSGIAFARAAFRVVRLAAIEFSTWQPREAFVQLAHDSVANTPSDDVQRLAIASVLPQHPDAFDDAHVRAGYARLSALSPFAFFTWVAEARLKRPEHLTDHESRTYAMAVLRDAARDHSREERDQQWRAFAGTFGSGAGQVRGVAWKQDAQGRPIGGALVSAWPETPIVPRPGGDGFGSPWDLVIEKGTPQTAYQLLLQLRGGAPLRVWGVLDRLVLRLELADWGSFESDVFIRAAGAIESQAGSAESPDQRFGWDPVVNPALARVIRRTTPASYRGFTRAARLFQRNAGAVSEQMGDEQALATEILGSILSRFSGEARARVIRDILDDASPAADPYALDAVLRWLGESAAPRDLFADDVRAFVASLATGCEAERAEWHTEGLRPYLDRVLYLERVLAASPAVVDAATSNHLATLLTMTCDYGWADTDRATRVYLDRLLVGWFAEHGDAGGLAALMRAIRERAARAQPIAGAGEAVLRIVDRAGSESADQAATAMLELLDAGDGVMAMTVVTEASRRGITKVLLEALARERRVEPVEGAARQFTWGDIQAEALKGITPLATSGDAAARDALVAALGSSFIEVRSAALTLLESLPAADALALFDRVASWPAWDAPVLFLGRIADAGAESRLLKIAATADVGLAVRGLAIDQFSQRAPSDAAFSALGGFTRDEAFAAPELRTAVYRVLRNRYASRFSDDDVLAALANPDAIARATALDMLADRYPEKDPKVPADKVTAMRAAVRALLNDSEFAVRAAAQRFLDIWSE